MRGYDLLEKLDLVDDAYLADAERMPVRRRAKLAAWSSMAACLALAVALGVSMRQGGLELPTDTLPPTTTAAPVSAPPSTTALPPTTTAPSMSRDALDEAWAKAHALDAIGGADEFFSRRYVDETYNLAYLRAPRDYTPLVDDAKLNAWVEEVFLRMSPEEQDALPTLYLAVRDLGIAEADFLALNAYNRTRGDTMVLDDDLIRALYLPEDEMKQALTHPLALWYAGEIYTWQELRDSPAEIPTEVLEAYLRRVMATCVEQGILREVELERVFGDAAHQ